MTMSLEERIDQLESRFAMLDLVSDYCLGFDKHDFDRFINIWWPDAKWDVGLPFGSYDGHKGITHAVKDEIWPAWQQATHYTTNLRVEFKDRDHADGICDVDCIGTTIDGLARTVGATYTDKFERRNGVWKIIYRHVKIHHFSELVGVTLAPPQ